MLSLRSSLSRVDKLCFPPVKYLERNFSWYTQILAWVGIGLALAAFGLTLHAGVTICWLGRYFD